MTAQRLHEILGGDPLTFREVQVLEGAAFGETCGQTAARVFLSVDTIKQYRKTAQAKLGAYNTTRAVVLAIGMGALNLDRLEVG